MFTKCGSFPDDPIPPRYLSSTNTSNINKKLLSEGKMIKTVLPDGNCFFRSVAVYVHGDEEYHSIVRKALCSHITANQDTYRSLLFHNSMTSHLKQMAKPCTWATQVELQAAANFYGTDLYVLTENPSKSGYHWICYTACRNAKFKENYCEKFFDHMQLAHSSSVHFDVIIDVKTKEVSMVRPVLEGRECQHIEVL